MSPTWADVEQAYRSGYEAGREDLALEVLVNQRRLVTNQVLAIYESLDGGTPGYAEKYSPPPEVAEADDRLRKQLDLYSGAA